jgi:hypothetical protein
MTPNLIPAAKRAAEGGASYRCGSGTSCRVAEGRASCNPAEGRASCNPAEGRASYNPAEGGSL